MTNSYQRFAYIIAALGALLLTSGALVILASKVTDSIGVYQTYRALWRILIGFIITGMGIVFAEYVWATTA